MVGARIAELAHLGDDAGALGDALRGTEEVKQGRRDSNPRPTVLETAALPTELRPCIAPDCSPVRFRRRAGRRVAAPDLQALK